MDVLNGPVRWLHIIAGVLWIGMLYFFNFVNGPMAGALDGDTKKKVVPELMPRALFWFRWGAAWTWVTGVLLLQIVFYGGKLMFDGGGAWTTGAIVMVVFPYVAPFLYDAIAKSVKDPKQFGAIAFVGAAITVALMAMWGGFSYRAFNIHLGATFGTIMAFNVWFRIWPAQQKIIRAVKEGQAPDAALVALAGARSRHNTYMSAPLLWMMINNHTPEFSGGNFGLPSRYPFVALLVVILVGWHVVWQFYKRAAKVKGF